MTKNRILRNFADILFYPDSKYKETVKECYSSLIDYEETYNEFSFFNEYIAEASISDIEDKFTYSFDLNPDCCLEVGWHLYGEEYARGEFMVKTRQRMQDFGLEETIELPDHLHHVLHLIPHLSPGEKEQMISENLKLALTKINEGLKDDNPYKHVIKALESFFEIYFQTQKSVAVC